MDPGAEPGMTAGGWASWCPISQPATPPQAVEES